MRVTCSCKTSNIRVICGFLVDGIGQYMRKIPRDTEVSIVEDKGSSVVREFAIT
jgi:hypothetical protein